MSLLTTIIYYILDKYYTCSYFNEQNLYDRLYKLSKLNKNGKKVKTLQ